VTLAALPVFVGCALTAAYLVYRVLGRYDQVTAFFSAAPGGLTDMLLIGSAAGGDERKIALAHATRILIVISVVVYVYNAVLDVGGPGGGRPFTGFADVPLGDLAILAFCALAGVWAAPRIGLPAPQVFGPMLFSGAAHLTSFTDSVPPTVLINLAQLIIGTTVGCRFVGVSPREVLGDIALATVASAAMASVALGCAAAVAVLTGTELRQVFLAFSPGGLNEMGILALAMHADVAYVASAHIVRIAVVIAIAPLAFQRLLART